VKVEDLRLLSCVCISDTDNKITAVNTHATVGDFIVKLDSFASCETEPMVNREYYLDKPMYK